MCSFALDHAKLFMYRLLSIAGTWDGESVREDTTDDSNGLQQIVDDPRRCLFCGVFGDQKPSVIFFKSNSDIGVIAIIAKIQDLVNCTHQF